MSGDYVFGLRVGEWVTHEHYPSVRGLVVVCTPLAVQVDWEDGSVGDFIWSSSVTYNAHRLQVVRKPVTLPRSDAS